MPLHGLLWRLIWNTRLLGNSVYLYRFLGPTTLDSLIIRVLSRTGILSQFEQTSRKIFARGLPFGNTSSRNFFPVLQALINHVLKKRATGSGRGSHHSHRLRQPERKPRP